MSRLIDAFANDPDIDADKVAVEGHSRYGKATLVTGAYDGRITVTWASDAGAMGTAMARRTYGETLDFVASSTSEYHWLAGRAMAYAGPLNQGTLFPRKVELLDVDAHSTTSLVAPRAIFVTNGTDTPPGLGDAWADPRGCFLSGLLASPVWNLLGWKGQIIPPGTVFTSPGQPGTSATSGPAESIGGTPPFDTAFIDGTVVGDVKVRVIFRFQTGRLLCSSHRGISTISAPPCQTRASLSGQDQSILWAHYRRPPAGPVHFRNGRSRVEMAPAYLKSILQPDITIPDPSRLDTQRTTPYMLTVISGDGILPSHDATVTIKPAPTVSGANQLMTTAVLAKLGDGSYQAIVTVANNGTGTTQNVRITSATLGGATSTTSLPQSLINIPPASAVSVAMVFPASAGSSGATVLERYTGTYAGGVFAGGLRATLP